MSFTGGGVGRRGACTTKKGYQSRHVAEKAADFMAENYGFYRPGLQIKLCPYKGCGLWHISHKIGKDRKGRRWETQRKHR